MNHHTLFSGSSTIQFNKNIIGLSVPVLALVLQSRGHIGNASMVPLFNALAYCSCDHPSLNHVIHESWNVSHFAENTTFPARSKPSTQKCKRIRRKQITVLFCMFPPLQWHRYGPVLCSTNREALNRYARFSASRFIRLSTGKLWIRTESWLPVRLWCGVLGWW